MIYHVSPLKNGHYIKNISQFFAFHCFNRNLTVIYYHHIISWMLLNGFPSRMLSRFQLDHYLLNCPPSDLAFSYRWDPGFDFSFKFQFESIRIQIVRILMTPLRGLLAGDRKHQTNQVKHIKIIETHSQRYYQGL